MTCTTGTCHLKITHSAEILLFFYHNTRACDVFVPSWHGFKKFHRGTKRTVAFAEIHGQQFPLLYNGGIGDLLNVASEVRTASEVVLVRMLKVYLGVGI